MAKIAPK